MFRETLENRINLRVALITNDELEDAVQKVVTDIQHLAWEATPLITTKVKGNAYQQEIHEKIAEKRKIRKRWQRLEALELKPN